jgi:hypothetical protein
MKGPSRKRPSKPNPFPHLSRDQRAMLAAEYSFLLEEWQTVKTQHPAPDAALAARRLFAKRDALAKEWGVGTVHLRLDREGGDDLLAALRILRPDIDWETPRASALDDVSEALIEWLRLEPQSEWDTQKADALEQARRALRGSDAWAWLSGYPYAALSTANDPNHLVMAAAGYYHTQLFSGGIPGGQHDPDLERRIERHLWAEHHMGLAEWHSLAWLEQAKILRRDYERQRQAKESPAAKITASVTADAASAGAPPFAEIISLGKRQYKIGDADPIMVEANEDFVLLAFLEQASMDGPMLINRAGFDNAPRVLRNICKKYDGRFAPAITLPRKKGEGGYHVAIRPQ